MKKILMLLMSLFVLVLSACGSNEVENIKINITEVEEKEKPKAQEEEAKGKEEEKTNDVITDFEELPLDIKVHLAVSIVDERANEHDLTGYTLCYS